MEIMVERVSKTGLGIASGGKWYNRGKNCNLNTFFGLEGKKVILDLTDDKWVNVVKISEQDVPLQGTKAEPSVTPTIQKPYSQRDPEVQAQINRSTAVKAVYDSPSLALLVQNGDLTEGISVLKNHVLEVTNYIQTGSFEGEEK